MENGIEKGLEQTLKYMMWVMMTITGEPTHFHTINQYTNQQKLWFCRAIYMVLISKMYGFTYIYIDSNEIMRQFNRYISIHHKGKRIWHY